MATKILHKSLLINSILTAASLAFSLEAMAAEVTQNGITYSLNETTLEATVTKCSCSFDYEGVELPATVSGDSEQQYTVVGIGKDAFSGCGNLKGIVAPSTVTDIGDAAFIGCSELTEVSFPSVTSIGTQAFKSCSSLTKVSFPNVTSIGKRAFYECESLAEVSFPNVTSIGMQAFSKCSIKTITLNQPDISNVNAEVYENFGTLSNITLYVPAEALSLYKENEAWSALGFKSIEPIKDEFVADGIVYTRIGKDSVEVAAGNCYEGELELPATVSDESGQQYTVAGIGSKAFYGCINLTRIVAPSTVTYIGENAFGFCQSLTEVTFPNATSIGENAFGYCQSLTEVTFPNATSIGIGTFAYCSSLTSVSFPNVTGIEVPAFSQCGNLKKVSFPKATSVGNVAFMNCGNLTEVYIPNATSIGVFAFNSCEKLEEVSFPNVTSIENGAFIACNSLVEVSFPNVTSIADDAFYDCPIKTITLDEPDPSMVDAEVYKKIGTSSEITLYVPAEALSLYKESTAWSGVGFKDILSIAENTPKYKARIYNGRDYVEGYVSMSDKLSGDSIAVVEEYVYDPDFDITQSENVIWLMSENQYMANAIRLVDSLPVYFSVGFLANEISYTRTPSIYNEKVEGETGWETLYLPFTATTVTADGVSITPFNYGGKEKTAENISAGNDFWAKEPVMDNENTLYFSHISDAKFEAGMPYLISFPGNGFGKYSLKNQKIVFSNANVNVAATDDLTAGVNCGQYTMAGTCEKLSSEDAANYYLFDVNSNMFQKNTEEAVAPFRCYVQKMGQSSEGGSSSGSNLKSSRGNVVFVGSYEDYMAQQDDNTTLQANASADQVVIYAQDGNIILVASESGDATISNLNGQVIKSVNYQEGLNNLGEFAQGVYLINGVKVIVK